MKKYLLSLATIAFMVAACNSNPKPDTSATPAMIADTANRSMSDRNQPVEMNGVSDTIIGSDGQVYIKAKSGATTPVADQPVRVAPPRSTAVSHTTPKKSTTSTHSSGSGTSTSSNSGNSGSSNTTSTTTTSGSSGTGTNTTTDNGSSTTTTTTPAEQPKKGWSGAAKGTAIGAAGGAVAGAIISKNKGLGAVVGGLIGAGGGYIIGKKTDKKKKDSTTTTTTNQ